MATRRDRAAARNTRGTRHAARGTRHAARGARLLAVEDPSANDDARLIAAQLGIEVVGVPVESDGVRIDALERLRADALIVTPSHQWPTGAVLSADARAAVVACGPTCSRPSPLPSCSPTVVRR
jgi:hypothetical protein